MPKDTKDMVYGYVVDEETEIFDPIKFEKVVVSFGKLM